MERLRAYQNRLYDRVKQDASLAQLPVLAPSLITWQDHALLGDMTGALDAGNKHSYPGGDIPEENLDRELADAARVSGRKRVYVTESGYHNAVATSGGHRPASEAAVGTYLPRMYLEYFRRGIARTFTYELIDQLPDPARTQQEANFGLLRNDGSEKPAFKSLSNLIALLSDRGPAFTAAPLDYSVAGAPADLRQLSLQKRDGSHYLVLWRATRVWDPVTRRAVAPVIQDVKVDLPGSAGRVQVYDPVAGTEPVATGSAAQGVSLALGGNAVIVRVDAPGPDAPSATQPATLPATLPGSGRVVSSACARAKAPASRLRSACAPESPGGLARATVASRAPRQPGARAAGST